MKKLYIAFIGLLLCQSLMSKDCSVDSIFLIGYNSNPTFSFSQDRKRTLDRFSDYLNDRDKMTNIIDTTITDQEEINTFLREIGNLKFCKSLAYGTKQILMNATFSINKKKIQWVTDQESSLDNRILLILYNKKGTEFIWLDNFYLDRGLKRYYLSSRMKCLISKYSQIYK